MLPQSQIQERMPEASAIEEVEVNLDEVIEVEDSSRDFNEISAPPPADIYPFSLILNLKKGGGNIKGIKTKKLLLEFI
jgi:hypothetical protein